MISSPVKKVYKTFLLLSANRFKHCVLETPTYYHSCQFSVTDRRLFWKSLALESHLSIASVQKLSIWAIIYHRWFLPSNLASGNCLTLNACSQQSFKDGILNTLKVVSGNHHGSSDIHQENNSAVDSLQPFISGNNRPFLRNRRRRSYTNLQPHAIPLYSIPRVSSFRYRIDPCWRLCEESRWLSLQVLILGTMRRCPLHARQNICAGKNRMYIVLRIGDKGLWLLRMLFCSINF